MKGIFVLGLAVAVVFLAGAGCFGRAAGRNKNPGCGDGDPGHGGELFFPDTDEFR